MSSNSGKRHEGGASQRAALARRISRQVAHDRDHRVAPPVTLPRLACLEEECDTDSLERRRDGEAPEREDYTRSLILPRITRTF
jgi:hypothetical protein